METITKKRLKAYFIDLAITMGVMAGVEYLLRKKIKSEVVHIFVTPVLLPWTLEYLQLKINHQTVGYKRYGLLLEDATGSDLTNKQILKRMMYSQMVSPIKYFTQHANFEQSKGGILPHDKVAGTIVREVE